MTSSAAIADLVDAASAPYRGVDQFGYRLARGKLRGDPVFTGILRDGLLAGSQRILDLGCGQGLLAAWLLAAQVCHDERSRPWPPGWPAAPRPVSIRGIDLREREVRRAREALGQKAQFEVGDITSVEYGTVDAAVILDVLHYIEYESQPGVLERVHAALAPDGVLLLRVSDAGSGIRFTIGKYIDLAVMLMHYRRSPRVFCRSIHDWLRVLTTAGFYCEAVPMSAGTPFANVMFIARPRKQVPTPKPMIDSLIA